MSTTLAPAPKLTNVGTRPTTPRKLFVNIPVADLQRSIDFFEKLGFTFNAQFTDATATAMLIGEDAYFMLLTLDAGIKLVRAKAAIEGSAQLGFTPDQVFVIGVIAAVCLVLYLIPRTAPIGAVLWTGYFGGALVTHFRLGNPLFTHILPPIYVSILIWGSLYLRDPRVRAVIGKR